MRFTLSWLKKFLETDADIYQVADALNKIGHEVEEIIDPAKNLAPFIVGEVKEKKPHPDADKLNICQVFNGIDVKIVVCGASNVAAGQKIVLAQPGVEIPANGLKIKISKIRGVESNGMICSEEELGLGSDSDGIMVLNEDAEPGKPFLDIRPDLSDPIIEVSITPNRSDCLGVYGIARDLAAYGIGRLVELRVDMQERSLASSKSIIIQDGMCEAFASIYIENTNNCESPSWLKSYLRAAGCNARNFAVDITNYINFSLGRPLHVFDADKISGNLVVRKAKKGEAFKALDGNEHILTDLDVVVADEKEVQALGGIIGGDLSKCENESHNLLLESALWDPIAIAKTSKRHKIESDAKYRFERGVDPMMTVLGLEIAADMISKYCGGQVYKTNLVGNVSCETKIIDFDVSLVKNLAGIDIPKEKIILILEDLGFNVEDNQALLKVKAPTWRHDINIPADLVEEVIRIYGYDQIQEVTCIGSSSEKILNAKEGAIGNIPTILAANGFDEVITWSFIDSKRAKKFGLDVEQTHLNNPISSEMDCLRPTLIPNLVEIIEKNTSRSINNISLFETGSVYFSSEIGDQAQYLAGVLTGQKSDKDIFGEARKFDIFDAKDAIFKVLEVFGYSEFEITCQQDGSALGYMHPGRTANIILRGKKVGYFGELHPQLNELLKLKNRVICFEISLDLVEINKSKFSDYIISDYQPVKRDFAFLLDKQVKVGEVLLATKKLDRKILREVNLFDLYEGERVEEGKKSIAMSVTLQSEAKTLDNTEISDLSDKIIDLVQKRFGGILRDS